MFRHAHSRDAAAGHSSDARQRPAAVLFRVLHLRYHRRPALGRTSPEPLLPRPARQRLAPVMVSFGGARC